MACIRRTGLTLWSAALLTRKQCPDLGVTKVETNYRGEIVVDVFYRTAEPGVYAAGDVIGGYWLAHVANHEGTFAKLVEGTPQEIGMTVHAHPTLAEAFGEAAMDVHGRAINF